MDTLTKLDPGEFSVERYEANDTVARSPELTVVAEKGMEVFHRVGKTWPGNETKSRTLVVRSGGVSVYIDRSTMSVIVTTKDLYP